MTDLPEPLTFLILDLARLIRQQFEADLEAAGLGMTAGEARTLLWANRFPGLRQTALAEKLGVEPMTLVGFLDRLEAAGLIVRLPDPNDRRAKLIHPTEAAKAPGERIEAIALSVRARAMAEIGEKELEPMRAGLTQMRAALSRAKAEDRS
jgi:DNA-binding MarR family transcriptional regulator